MRRQHLRRPHGLHAPCGVSLPRRDLAALTQERVGAGSPARCTRPTRRCRTTPSSSSGLVAPVSPPPSPLRSTMKLTFFDTQCSRRSACSPRTSSRSSSPLATANLPQRHNRNQAQDSSTTKQLRKSKRRGKSQSCSASPSSIAPPSTTPVAIKTRSDSEHDEKAIGCTQREHSVSNVEPS